MSEKKESAVGNAAAMRELVRRIVKSLGGKAEVAPANMTAHEVAILNQCRAALSAPPRNCDVGTAEEQSQRFDVFVRDRRGDLNCTGKCPAHNGVDFGVVNCVLRWAQIPYEEGGAK